MSTCHCVVKVPWIYTCSEVPLCIVQQRRSVGRLQSLQMGPAIRDHLSMADRSGSSGFHSSGEGKPRPFPHYLTLCQSLF